MGNRGLWLVIALPAAIVAVALGFQDRGPSAPAGGKSPFSSTRAYQDLEAVVGFGPRPAGSPALAETRDYVVRELEAAGLEPILDTFLGQTPSGPIPMTNIRAIRPGRTDRTILVGGHYDTKRYDFDFVGANDGGSSTAVVLELARVTGDLDLDHTLEFIFFDGEEAVRDWTDTDSRYGSRYDVQRRVESGGLDGVGALILVDMIGDRDLGILRESASAGWLADLIWKTAAGLGHGDHFGPRLSLVDDDHVPYLQAGVPAIDLIDFDYPYWHTREDTLDKTSAESLGIVGDVLYAVLPEVDGFLETAN